MSYKLFYVFLHVRTKSETKSLRSLVIYNVYIRLSKKQRGLFMCGIETFVAGEDKDPVFSRCSGKDILKYR